MRMKSTLTYERLRELLHYDPVEGVFTWIVDRMSGAGKVKFSARAGDRAGFIDPKGYIKICVDTSDYFAHRLAFLYMTGEWPAEQIDHKNRVKDDCRWVNLREATHSQNKENESLRKDNKSGVKGVLWDARRQCWCAHLVKKPVRFYKRCKKFEDAVVARKEAENRYFTHHVFES